MHEKIHCGLINLLIIDPAKTANNCSITDKFEHKFQILINFSEIFFSFVVSNKCSDTRESFYAWKVTIVYY